MLKQIIMCIALCLIAVCNPLHASEANLQQFFFEVQSMRAKFIQTVLDESGMIVDQSQGSFYLKRPARFRWDYFESTQSETTQTETTQIETKASPMLVQQLLADGKEIVMYDVELEQATKRSMDNALQQVPSLVLVQNDGELDQHFVVSEYDNNDSLDWVSLQPLHEDAGYQSLRIGFDGSSLKKIQLVDALGNETRLSLFEIEKNVSLADDLFIFTAPENTDIFGD